MVLPEPPSRPAVLRPHARDHLVVLHGVPWEHYDALCARDASGPRLAYLDGELEIMSPSPRHEIDKKLISRFLEAFAEERELSMNGIGSATFRKQAEEAGVEPDECYVFGPVEKEFPDLAIEVVYRSGGIDKLEIYRRLNVAEVWFWKKGGFTLHRLGARRYQVVERSEVLPSLDLAELARMIQTTDPWQQTEAVRAYRRSLR